MPSPDRDVIVRSEQQRRGLILALELFYNGLAVDEEGKPKVAQDDIRSPEAVKLARIARLFWKLRAENLPYTVDSPFRFELDLIKEALAGTDPSTVTAPGSPGAVPDWMSAYLLTEPVPVLNDFAQQVKLYTDGSSVWAQR
jgi:hypothetical protein